MTYDPWLERWIPALRQATAGASLLEIGCGSGQDTVVLLEHGLKVVAFDLSEEEVTKARIAAPDAMISVQSALQPFPHDGTSLGAIVASLSLHYFRWHETVSLINRIHGALKPGGLLLARFNSDQDVNYGATGYPEIERGLFSVEGQAKRFFSQADISALFGQAWRVLSIERAVIHRYHLPKSIWEVAVASAA
jgi:SAM-dependent methyltransferase